MGRVLSTTVMAITSGVLWSPGLVLAATSPSDQALHMLTAVFFVVPVIYFVPSIIAATKDHPQPGAVFWLNLCLGWTLVGWCVSLFWAVEKGRPMPKAAGASDEFQRLGKNRRERSGR